MTQRLHDLCAAVALAENQIEQLYLRWDELHKKRSRGSPELREVTIKKNN